MANQAAIWVMTTRATEVLVDATSHVVEGEIAGLAALNGVQIRPDAPDWARHERRRSRSGDSTAVALRSRAQRRPAVENTHNSAGGVITPVTELRKIRDVARAHGLPVDLDGARLWNAAVETGTSLAEFAACADTVMVAFSKGLGAPIGGAVVGPSAIMERLWTARKLFGGAMRRSGILAAGALYAIDHHMDRLAGDHRHARLMAGKAASTVLVGPRSSGQTRTS